MDSMQKSENQLMISANGSSDDLFQLLEWFNDNDTLRGRVNLPTSRINPGQMGDLANVLVVALGAGGIATALTQSLTTWFTVRRSNIAITLKSDSGTEITLDAQRVKMPEFTQALQSMVEQLNNRS